MIPNEVFLKKFYEYTNFDNNYYDKNKILVNFKLAISMQIKLNTYKD